MHKRGGRYREKNREKKTKEKNRGDNRSEKTKERTQRKKKPRTEGGEIEKRRRRRAFSSRCLHCYLCLRRVKSSFSLCFYVIVARK
jgi:hypothetical protein